MPPKSPSLLKAAALSLFLAASALTGCIATPAPAQQRGETVRAEFPIPAGFKAAYQEVDGVNLHYIKGGEGPLVLLVHGFGQTWYEWHQIMPELARTHTVVAVDLPGLGLSTAPPSYAGQDVAALLYAFAKTFSPDAPFDLVAHDIGIWNTYPMVAEHQSDIRRLVYMEAPIPDDGLYTWPAFTPQGESLAWHFSFFAAENRLAEQMITGNERLFLEHFIKVHAKNKAAFTPELIDLYTASYSKPPSLNASMEYYRALNETARRNKPLAANPLAMPILAIGGGDSMAAAQGDQLQRYGTNVRSEVIPNCGHWLPEECPAPLNALVVEFLTAD